MHPKKEEALAQIADGTRQLDEGIDWMKDIASNPGREGWGKSLKAAATIPLLGVGAVMADVADFVVRRIGDDKFERDFPTS